MMSLSYLKIFVVLTLISDRLAFKILLRSPSLQSISFIHSITVSDFVSLNLKSLRGNHILFSSKDFPSNFLDQFDDDDDDDSIYGFGEGIPSSSLSSSELNLLEKSTKQNKLKTQASQRLFSMKRRKIDSNSSSKIQFDKNSTRSINIELDINNSKQGSATATNNRPQSTTITTDSVVHRSIGIDLGTTNSVVSVVEGGIPIIIPVNGQRLVPSVVSFASNGEIIVGESARRLKPLHPLNTYSSVKRVIGRTMKEIKEADENTETLNIDPASGLNATSLCRLFPPNFDKSDNKGKKTTENNKIRKEVSSVAPEDISAEVIRALVTAASNYLGAPVTRAVVTVPAYFRPSQCEATERAALKAGLQKVKLLREPEAAALAYGLREKQQQLVLVFDLGGGTFDVSVLEVGGGLVEVVATSGDAHLGGDDFDHLIVHWLKEQFAIQNSEDSSFRRSSSMATSSRGKDKKHWKQQQEVENPAVTNGVPYSAQNLKDPWVEARLIRAAEEARIQLSVTDSVTIDLPLLVGTHGITCNLTRHKLESLCKPILTRLLRPLREVAIMSGINLPGDSGQLGFTSEQFTGELPESDPTFVDAPSASESLSNLKKQQLQGRAAAKEKKRVQGTAGKELRRLQKTLGDPSLSPFPRGMEANQVLLIGGVTRMPMIRRLVQTVTGKVPKYAVNPDEAVSLGAAVLAGIMDGDIEGMQVMTSWQAAMVRAFHEQQIKDASKDSLLADIQEPENVVDKNANSSKRTSTSSSSTISKDDPKFDNDSSRSTVGASLKSTRLTLNRKKVIS